MSSPKAYYDAEFALRFLLENGGTYEFYGSKLTLPQEARFASLDSIAAYIDRVYSHLELPGAQPKIRQRKGEAKAHYERFTQTIAVPMRSGWACREIVVLHELAHHLTWAERESHGPLFCSCLVFLITHCIGYEAGLILSAEYGERGIQITPYAIQ